VLDFIFTTRHNELKESSREAYRLILNSINIGINIVILLQVCHILLIFGFHKMRGISWLAETRLASQEGLRSMDSLFN